MADSFHSVVVDQCVSPAGMLGRTRIAWNGEGRITAVTATTDDADAHTAIPGLIDSHFHGFAGVDVLNSIPTAAEWRTLDRRMLMNGVTSYLPAICRSEPEEIARLVETARGASLGGLLGFYCEGPFVHADCAGALSKDQLRKIDLGLCREILEAGGRAIRIMMISPELADTRKVIEYLQANQVTPAIGHSHADAKTTRRAIAAGARRITHWPNALAWGDHHDPKIAFQVLADDRVYLEIIGDGLHVAPVLMEVARRCKREKLIGVSDGMFPAGLKNAPRRFARHGFEMRGRRLFLAGTGVPAGSVVSLYQCFRNLSRCARFEIEEATRVCSSHVAASLDLSDRGELSVGKRADLLLLDEHGGIEKIIRKGVVYGR